MMNIQEQEEREFVHESEASMCFQEANQYRAKLDADGAREVEAALRDNPGKFVLVVREPYYCKATDAYAGDFQVVRGMFDSRAAAMAAAVKELEDSHGEVSPEVLPRLPGSLFPVLLDLSAADEDVPF